MFVTPNNRTETNSAITLRLQIRNKLARGRLPEPFGVFERVGMSNQIFCLGANGGCFLTPASGTESVLWPAPLQTRIE